MRLRLPARKARGKDRLLRGLLLPQRPGRHPLVITNSTGAEVWRADYKPFGEENKIYKATKSNDQKFTGKKKDDETGLYYFGARYMDPTNGRFLTVDPVGPVDSRSGKTNEKILRDPQRLNGYAYALNSPYRYVDPTGEIPIDTIWDLANIVYDIATGDWGSLAADSAALAIPYVPAGITKVSKAGKALTKAAKGVDKAPDFVVSPGGTAFPVPKGATGPTPVISPSGKLTGDAFTGGGWRCEWSSYNHAYHGPYATERCKPWVSRRIYQV